MENQDLRTYTAFCGHVLIASGQLCDMLAQTKELVDRNPPESILIFEDWSGQQVDFDFRGTIDEVYGRVAPAPAPQGGARGRPRLGVVSREVSLLPRHWEWLEAQPNGASAALRRLIEEARRRDSGQEKARLAANAAGRFMWAIAGNLPGFEEASRALYAGNRERFEAMTEEWPRDIREHLRRLAAPCFGESPANGS